MPPAMARWSARMRTRQARRRRMTNGQAIPLIDSKRTIMEHLFSTQLNVKGQATDYEVTFSDETYHFRPARNEAPLLEARRQHDEWQLAGSGADTLGAEAVLKLDAYLLSQH
jgi:hypothetical protein